jgi:sugar phosphate isomerase/epimerase
MRWSLATIVLVPRGQTAHTAKEDRHRAFAWAAQTGFTGVEISPHWLNIGHLSNADLTAVGREAAAAGLVISGVNINRCILTRSERAPAHLASLERAIDAASLWQAPLVTLSLSLPLDKTPRPIFRGHEVSDAERDQTAALLRTLAHRAGNGGVRLSLELHDDGLLDTPELCLDMLRRVAAPTVGVNPDLGNLIRGNDAADWRSALQLLAPHTNNWHVKNYRADEPAPLWDGDIDYTQALPIIQAAGYQGWVSIESYFGNVLDLQERSLAYLKRLLSGPTA